MRARPGEFPEAEVIWQYFKGETRFSLKVIVQKMKLSAGFIRRRFYIISYWLGIPTKSKDVQRGAEFLEDRLKRVKEAEKKEAYHQSFAIGSQLPPVGLPPNRYSKWRQLTLKKEERENLSGIEQFVLDHFFMLDGKERRTLEDCGNEFDLTRSRMYQIKNDALEKLGVR
jgi:hypothetical protein